MNVMIRRRTAASSRGWALIVVILFVLMCGSAGAQQDERQVTTRTPPTFLFHTFEDASVPVENSLVFFEALRASKVPADLHVFVKGPHGVGLAPTSPALSLWPKLCAAWLDTMGFLTRG
jgi:acetyl esterase/lipase